MLNYFTQTSHGDKIKSKQQLTSLLSEVETLSSLSHPKIVGFYGVLWPSKAFPAIASYSSSNKQKLRQI